MWLYGASSNANIVLAVVILSVCPSVTRALWQNQTIHCGYFDTTRKGNHSSFLTPTAVGRRRHLPSEICAQSDPPPLKQLTCVISDLMRSKFESQRSRKLIDSRFGNRVHGTHFKRTRWQYAWYVDNCPSTASFYQSATKHLPRRHTRRQYTLCLKESSHL